MRPMETAVPDTIDSPEPKTARAQLQVTTQSGGVAIALLNKWSTRQVDSVLAYPQANIEVHTYMEIPKGFKFNGSQSTHCLLLKKNLYGQKQAGRV
jgi:Reverse transcriptase (RNA-dependent DNA polymerase)